MFTVVDLLSHQEATSLSPGNTQQTRRSVQFSESSELVLYQKTDHVVQWDSIADKARFKRDLRSDAHRMRRVVANSSAEDVSQDDICCCVGIEHLLSIERARQVIAHRRNHARTILQAQAIVGEDGLCEISMESSWQSREKAHKLAYGYSKM